MLQGVTACPHDLLHLIGISDWNKEIKAAAVLCISKGKTNLLSVRYAEHANLMSQNMALEQKSSPTVELRTQDKIKALHGNLIRPQSCVPCTWGDKQPCMK